MTLSTLEKDANVSNSCHTCSSILILLCIQILLPVDCRRYRGPKPIPLLRDSTGRTHHSSVAWSNRLDLTQGIILQDWRLWSVRAQPPE